MLSLHFLIMIARCNDVSCDFWCNPAYRDQLQELIPSDANVFVTSQKHEASFDLWGGNCLKRLQARDPPNYHKIQVCDWNPGYANVCKTYFEMNSLLCKELGVTCPFLMHEDILFNEEVFQKNTLDQKFDYLLVNSYCLSGQVKYSPQQQDSVFLDIIDQIIKKHKTFITTQKLLHFPSTRDYNLSLVQIGQLAKNCKILIGVPTAPFLACLNKLALQQYDKIFNVTHDACTFEFGRKCITVNSNVIPIPSMMWKGFI